jgi:hypothetical protein
MKSFVMAAALGLSLAAASAHAQTAIQPGLWEVSDKTTMEGVQPMPSTSRQVCIKGGEATLERLLYPTPDDFAKHGCSFAPGPKQAGIFKATTACPATDQTPGVTAEAEISYSPTSSRVYPHGQEQGRHDGQRQFRVERQEGRRLPLALRTP